MHKRLLNELTLFFDLEPASPLLIKSGREAGADPTLPDMNFVRATPPGGGEPTVFLPGSSLKGTLRSYVEKVLRTVWTEGGPEWCCDPFDDKTACGRRLTGRQYDRSPSARYKDACSACKLFGHTGMASHLALSDAYLVPGKELRIEQRDGVAIDRVTGAVTAGPFTMEIVTRGTFRAMLSLRNFQLWQVGLLAVALRDIGAGRVPVGFGKSKGLGKMGLTYDHAEVAYPGRFALQSSGYDFTAYLYGLNAFDFPAKDAYGLFECMDDRAPLPEGGEVREDGTFGRVVVRFAGRAAEGMLIVGLDIWREYVLAHRSGEGSDG